MLKRKLRIQKNLKPRIKSRIQTKEERRRVLIINLSSNVFQNASDKQSINSTLNGKNLKKRRAKHQMMLMQKRFVKKF